MGFPTFPWVFHISLRGIPLLPPLPPPPEYDYINLETKLVNDTVNIAQGMSAGLSLSF